MADNSPIQRLRDGVAKRLWSGDVVDNQADSGSVQIHHRNRNGWSPTEVSVSKASETGLRRGNVPEHIASPFKGRRRTANPLSLRQLAQTGTVQSIIGAILGDMEDIPWDVVPIDEHADPDEQLIREAEDALRDPNPNPVTFDDVNQMLGRDLLEVANCAAVLGFNIDGRRVEAVPYDPTTFTVDWDDAGILTDLYQYPKADQRWGDPTQFDRDEVMWGVNNPSTQRVGLYGKSPIEFVNRFINIMGGLVDKEVEELEEGMPSGMIALIGDGMSKGDYQNFRTYWKNEVAGNQVKHPVAEGFDDAKFVPFNMTYKELQVLDRQKWYSKLVSSAFRVPVSETGLAIGEEMTRATDVSQHERYKKRALGALLGNLEDLWTHQFLHPYFSDQIRVRFDPGRDIMERSELSKIHTRQVKSGLRTINEIREEQGLSEVAWGDKPPAARSGGSGGLQDTAEPEPGSQRDLESSPPGDTGDGLMPDITQGGDGGSGGSPPNFSDGGDGDATIANGWDGEQGTWLPDGVDVITSKALRETDNWRQFSYQPSEIESLQDDLEELFDDAIESVLNQVRGNQKLLRRQGDDPDADPEGVYSQKNLPEFVKLIEKEIGLSFAEDVGEILTEHKTEKITDGEDDILSELEQAGMTTEDIDLDQTRDRVVRRIQRRSLKVTKPISERLEGDLRDVLSEGWQKGWSITDVESAIEDVTDKWTGTDAERLARDQLGRASKEGRTAYARETSSEVGGWERTWITTIDGRERESHAMMDGETVGMDEPWVVDYTANGGPASVKEDYPGDSEYGIQCRCDFALSPKTTVAKVRKWADDPTRRMVEVADEHGQPIDQLLLGAELGDESRTQAHKRLGVSRPTYYSWIKKSGLADRR